MYSKCVQLKLILIGQIVKLVGKWPMANCYSAICILYSINPYTIIIKTNIPYNRPAFLAASCLNSEYTSSYTLIRVRN